jgi:hypothetical protein
MSNKLCLGGFNKRHNRLSITPHLCISTFNSGAIKHAQLDIV